MEKWQQPWTEALGANETLPSWAVSLGFLRPPGKPALLTARCGLDHFVCGTFRRALAGGFSPTFRDGGRRNCLASSYAGGDIFGAHSCPVRRGWRKRFSRPVGSLRYAFGRISFRKPGISVLLSFLSDSVRVSNVFSYVFPEITEYSPLRFNQMRMRLLLRNYLENLSCAKPCSKGRCRRPRIQMCTIIDIELRRQRERLYTSYNQCAKAVSKTEGCPSNKFKMRQQ